ncbi:MAG: MFS transporter [bacterium]
MKKINNVTLLSLCSLFTDASSEMLYPLLPVLLSQLGAPTLAIGFIEGIAESTASLTKIFFGRWSDKIKKRKLFAQFGYGLSIVGQILLPLASSWVYILVGRFINRIGKGIRTAPRDALLAESSAADHLGRTFGLHRAADTAGATIGVVMAYLILKNGFGVQNAIWWSLIPAIIGWSILSLVSDKKTETTQLDKPKWEFDLKALPTQLKIFYLISLVFAIGNSSNIFLMLKALNIGFTSANVILLYLLYNIIHMLASYPAGWLADKTSKTKVLAIGYAIFGVSYLCLAFFSNQIAYTLIFAIYGLYSGLTDGVEKSYVASLSPKHLKATYQGMHATIIGAALLPASLLAGFLWQYVSPAAPFYFSALTGFIGSLLIVKIKS